MYALIYDEHNLDQSQKKVISVHETREESEKALSQRQNELGKRVWDCNTRIVWTDKAVAPVFFLRLFLASRCPGVFVFGWPPCFFC